MSTVRSNGGMNEVNVNRAHECSGSLNPTVHAGYGMSTHLFAHLYLCTSISGQRQQLTNEVIVGALQIQSQQLVVQFLLCTP